MKVQFSSLTYLHDIKTFITYFFISPIIQMILFMLINQQYSNETYYSIAIGSIFMSANAMTISTINQLLVTDAILDIHKEMIVHNPYSIKYWGDKFDATFLCSLFMFFINSVILVILGLDILQIFTAISILPLSILYSLLFSN